MKYDGRLSTDSPPWRIERAGACDVARIVPLLLAYLRFYEMPADAPRVTAFLTERLAQDESIVLLAHDAGRDVGFAQLYPTFASLEQRPLWTLEDIFVAPEARSRGIARALLTRAEELARAAGAIRLRLETAHDNAPAQRLYEICGWRRDTVFRVYTREL